MVCKMRVLHLYRMPRTWCMEADPSEEHTAGNLHRDTSDTAAWSTEDHLFAWGRQSWKALKVEPTYSAEVKILSVTGTWTEQLWEQGLQEKNCPKPSLIAALKKCGGEKGFFWPRSICFREEAQHCPHDFSYQQEVLLGHVQTLAW